MFYPLSLIVISVTSCCVGLSLLSRDSQTGSGSSSSSSSRCDVVTSPKRANEDGDTEQICQVNCDSSSTLERSSLRRSRLPVGVPAAPPVNYVDQSLMRHHPHVHYQTHIDATDAAADDDRRRTAASPANSLSLSRSNSRSNVRPSSRHHAELGSSMTSYQPIGRTAMRSKTSVNEGQQRRRRLERLERGVDMCLFVLLVLICVGLAVCLIFMSF